jgi:hypothetical protein
MMLHFDLWRSGRAWLSLACPVHHLWKTVCPQVSRLLGVNRASLCAVFDHYATAVISAKHAKSATVALCDIDPTATELTRDSLPTRRMSLTQLCLFCQDFGILPALCDIVSIQDAFALVKSRLVDDQADFVDLLHYIEFEEILVRIAFEMLEPDQALHHRRLQLLLRLLEESGGRRKLSQALRSGPSIRSFQYDVAGVEPLLLKPRHPRPESEETSGVDGGQEADGGPGKPRLRGRGGGERSGQRSQSKGTTRRLPKSERRSY